MTTPTVPDGIERDAFAVEWENPGDAELTWELDDMHSPNPLAPLAMDYLRTLTNGMNPAFARFGVDIKVRAMFFQGRYYIGEEYGFPLEELSAAVESLRRARRALVPGAAAYWTNEALPFLRGLYAGIRGIDVDGLSAAALVERWEAAWAGMDEAWAIHFLVVGPAYRVVEDLADLYEAATPGAAPGEAPRLTQGATHVLQDVEDWVERLAAMTSDRPAVARWLTATEHPALERLESLDGGREIGGEIRRFLAEHGHLGQPFDDLTLPSWREEPSILLAELAQRVRRHPQRRAGTSAAESNAERRARLQAEAEGLVDAARARLAPSPDDLARFEEQLAHAREVAPLTEVHNYWIDRMGQAALRELAVRVGARLVRSGVIDAPADVFYLHRAEIVDLLLAPSDRRDVVAERRREHVRQREIQPPSYIGAPPPELDTTSRFSGTPGEPDAEDGLKGTGASAGVVRGPARLVLGPEDFGRVAPGDIIVCPSSNPSWVPVFSIAGGLVTNTGGVLSHAAVVAREFGLPAVVGATGATTRIVDDREIEIDGTAGTVRLL